MQAQVFGSILDEAVTRLNVSALLQNLAPFVTRGTNHESVSGKSRLPQLIFDAREGFVLMKQDKAKAEMLELLGFGRIFSPNGMTEILTILISTQTTQDVWNSTTNFLPFISFYTSLLTLRTFNETFNTLVLSNRRQAVGENEAIISLEVLDYDNGGIEPNRLVGVITDLMELHETVRRVLEVESSLRIVAMDSGSNSVVTLKADGKVMKELRLLIKQIWEAIRFWNLNDFDRRLKSLDKGLDMIQAIDKRVTAGTLDSHTAEILKHNLKAQALAIVTHGSLPKEIIVDATVETSQLLLEKRDLKLLTTGEQAAKTSQASPSSKE